MPRLEIQAAGLTQSERRELGDGQALLVGRSPDPARVSTPAEPVAIRSQSVSTNHLLAWREGGASFVRDLGSRNGTWLRLPSDAAVRIDGDAPLLVQLAAPPAATP